MRRLIIGSRLVIVSVDSRSSANDRMLGVIVATELKTQFWVSCHPNFFEGLADDAAVEKGVQMIGIIARRAKDLGCKVALYNHDNWFGEPKNQICIIKSLPDDDFSSWKGN